MKYYKIFGKKVQSEKLDGIMRRVLRESAIIVLALISGFAVWLIMSV